MEIGLGTVDPERVAIRRGHVESAVVGLVVDRGGHILDQEVQLGTAGALVARVMDREDAVPIELGPSGVGR